MRGQVALLLRVGIDKGSGGCLAPIFANRRFEYIPIPERCATSESKVYANMYGINGKPVVEYLPEKIREKIWCAHPHYDPEFDTFTYGDPTKIKRRQLSQLRADDLLIFYAGLVDREDRSRLYVIGYFDVEKVYDFKMLQKADYDYIFKKVPNNAHSKRYFKLRELDVEYTDDNLVIVKGKSPPSSKRCPKALLLGDENGKITKDLKEIFGYSGSLKRSPGHRITGTNFHKVKEWLNKECCEKYLE